MHKTVWLIFRIISFLLTFVFGLLCKIKCQPISGAFVDRANLLKSNWLFEAATKEKQKNRKSIRIAVRIFGMCVETICIFHGDSQTAEKISSSNANDLNRRNKTEENFHITLFFLSRRIHNSISSCNRNRLSFGIHFSSDRSSLQIINRFS